MKNSINASEKKSFKSTVLSFLLLALIAGLGLFGSSALADCPSADFTGDCLVNFRDFAILSAAWLSDDTPTANWNPACDISDPNDGVIDELDLDVFAAEWLTEGIPGNPNIMIWVSISDPGVGDDHEGFTGDMSKYETTNAQYCGFLNAALASGDVIVDGNNVKGADGSDFAGEGYYSLAGPGWTANGAINGGAARINYTGSSFTVDIDFNDHPVTYVTWYGSTAFCNYYGYRLPTQWEWQAVADYNGSYVYGCGTDIDNGIANYRNSTHPNGTADVGSFGDSSGYGYGMCDMAGSVYEWTRSDVPGYNFFVIKGGNWEYHYSYCEVSHVSSEYPDYPRYDTGFRVSQAPNNPPTVSLWGIPPEGYAPLTVNFYPNAADVDGDPLTYEWDFNGDTVVDSTLEEPIHTFETVGVHTVTLKVSDGTDVVETGMFITVND
ncbi:MAG: SUMF1/EgtB/PvdO family nonheme iron enzyme [SAR324 cluster bacterium]|nr:SUMF1/EgtB/PvdO family nonheme iron enzyme [SAR324 cluster bacterium]